MNSEKMTSAKAEPITKQLGQSNVVRIAALSGLVLFAAIAVPPGLAIGPTQPHAMPPADPAVAAAALRSAVPSSNVSMELIEPTDELSEISSSYAELRVGPLSFPEGAIEVPWGTSLGATTGRAFPADGGIAQADAGQTTSAPRAPERSNARPQIIQAAYHPAGPATAPTAEAMDGVRLSVAFDRQSTQLTSDEEDQLNTIAVQLQDGNFRIELHAFGGAASDRSHSARRTALRRALAVRNHLMDAGINQERIIVRALGGATDGGPSDRVDIIAPEAQG